MTGKNQNDSLNSVLSLGKDSARDLSKLRVSIRQVRENHINEIFNLIGEKIDYLSIDYDESLKVIVVKIKKTSMKKKSNFVHDVSYYYPIFETIFEQFRDKHLEEIKDEYSKKYDEEISASEIVQDSIGMYNLLPILDNIINVYI